LAFCQAIQSWLKTLVRPGEGWVLSGDYNIAHEEIDLRNPKTNTQNAGFLPEERTWMTQFLSQDAVDVFRKLHPSEGGHYTWWSYRPGVRQKNIGWRIDYHCVNPGLFSAVKSCFIQPGVMGSDHCPLVLELVGCEKVIHLR
jgi:exodeoxyribonuclease-3